MKHLRAIVLYSLVVAAALPLRAQTDGGTIDLGTTSGATIIVNNTTNVTSGTLTLSGSTALNFSNTQPVDVSLTSTFNLSLGTVTTVPGTTLLAGGTLTNSGDVTLTSAGTFNLVQNSVEGLSLTTIQNTISGATTAFVSSGTLATGGTLTLTGTNTLSLLNSGNLSAVNLAGAGQLVASGSGRILLTPAAMTTLPSITGSVTIQANFSTGLGFQLMPAYTRLGGLGTTLRLLDGTASVDRAVNATFLNGIGLSLASDIADVSGTISDKFVLELSYSEAAALTLGITEDALRLHWLNPVTQEWQNAVEGNTGGTPTFVAGAYDPSVDFELGYYGVDTANNKVWAVVNHNSEFAAAPEPGSAALLGLGGVLLGMRRRRCASLR